MTSATTLYDLLGVSPTCTFEELRAAYRSKARENHPDTSSRPDAARFMAAVNEAWRILSDPDRRKDYDASMGVSVVVTVPPPPQARRSRRHAWVAGVQAQIVRLSRLAGRSAVQTLLLRGPRAPRPVYDAIVDGIVGGLAQDTEARVRAARAAGAAPLDLGVAATLVGIRTMGDRLRREASLGITDELVMTAELLDRMWDVLAHELPHALNDALGGNPQLARSLLTGG